MPRDIALDAGKRLKARVMMSRGDEACKDMSLAFDDPDFVADQTRRIIKHAAHLREERRHLRLINGTVMSVPALPRPEPFELLSELVVRIDRDDSIVDRATLSLATVLDPAEQDILEEVCERRLLWLRAERWLCGWQHFKWLGNNGRKLSGAVRQKLAGKTINFPGLIVADKDGRRYWPCLRDDCAGGMIPGWQWLDRGFTSSDLIAVAAS